MSTLNVANISDDQSTLTNSANPKDNLNNTTTVDTKFVTNGCAKVLVFANSSAGIQSSLNLSSSTFHGTGDYSYGITNSFANISDIMVVATVRTIANVARIAQQNSDRGTISSVAIITVTDSAAAANHSHCASAHGELA
jgi:hypothetical protein